MTPRQPFKVLIIGGSVSGLTLANALDRANIEFLVLEKRPDVVYGAGAALGLLPNGLRILDQLNVSSELMTAGTPIHTMINRWKDGQPFSKSHFTQRIAKRHGYPFLFIEREFLLRALYAKLADKNKVYTSKECIEIRHLKTGVRVTCKDGSTHEADIVVGADGVHSTSRRVMLALIPKKKSCGWWNVPSMFSDYFCLLGESIYESHDPELAEGTMSITCDKKRIFILICCKGHKKFWFLYLKYPIRHQYPDIPRLSPEEIEVTMMANFDIKVTEHLSPEDLWNCRSECIMVPFEEGLLDHWYANRIVCQGDAVYKMTPNAGFGANCAIESAACLANVFDKLIHQTQDDDLPTYSEIQRIFAEYQQLRMGRVKAAYETSYFFTRFQALDNKLLEIIYTRITPMLGEDFEINALTNIVLGGSALTFVDYKGREGTVPWGGWDLLANMKANHLPIMSTKACLLRYIALATAGSWLVRDLASATGFMDREPLHLKNPFLHASIFYISRMFEFSQRRSTDSTLHTWSSLGAFGNLLAIGTVITVESFRGSSADPWNILPWIVGIGLNFTTWKHYAVVYLLVLSRNLLPSKSRKAPFSSVSPTYATALVGALITVTAIHFIAITTPKIGWSKDYTSPTKLPLVYPMILAALSWALALLGNFYNRSETIMGTTEIPMLQGAYVASAILSLTLHIYSTFKTTLIDTSTYQAFLLSLMRVVLGATYVDGDIFYSYILFISCSMIVAYANVTTFVKPGHKTISARLHLSAKMMIGTAVVGPGATVAMVWLWREDRVRNIDL